jgi:murein DD-endopeptidase MepM/ murein hydrolase activator NlpD
MGLLKDGFTLILIPQKTSKVLRLRISRNGLIAIAAGVAVFSVLGVFSIFRAAQLRIELASHNALRNDYLRQQIGIRRVANQVDQFKSQIDRMRELDYKLRLITDLEVDRPTPAQYGIGGGMDPRGDGLKDADLAKLDLIALLDKDLARLEKMAQYQEESFNNLKAFLADQKDLIERSPYRWPVRGFLSSTFGPRVDPFTGQQRMHEAIDIVAPKGTPVKAPADGIVTFSGSDPTFGNMLVIDHGYGVITRYGHNDSILVREGQRVKRGDTICTVGMSGRSTGPHLHYEIRINDVAINPLNMIIN